MNFSAVLWKVVSQTKWQSQPTLEPSVHHNCYWRYAGAWQNTELMAGHNSRATDGGSTPEIKWVKAGGEHNSGVSGDWSTERRALVSDRSEERSIALLGMKLTRA